MFKTHEWRGIQEVTLKDCGSVTFGDNSKTKAISYGSIGQTNSTKVEKVFPIQGLKHNLLSISQLCDDNKIVIFYSVKCLIIDKNLCEIKMTAKRHRNMYIVHLDNLADQGICLLASMEDSVIL